MKTTLHFLVIVLSIGVLSAQQRATLPYCYKDLAKKSDYVRPYIANQDLPVYKVSNSTVSTTPFEVITEDIIGTTWYDLQSNASLQNRLYCYNDGTIGATWTMGIEATAFPDRGTGYNYFDGSVWQAQPTARIETFRAGWPSYSPWGSNGEIVVSHDFASLKLDFMTRSNKGTGTWDQKVYNYSNGPTALAWPRMITSGPDNNTIHLLANTDGAYQGQPFGIVYSRSLDGGNTWDIENVVLDGTGADYYTEITADQYTWSNPVGDTIAFIVASAFHDLFMMKSTDNGDSWQKTVIWEHPYPLFDFNTMTMDTVFVCDNSASIAMDKSGKCHVVFGLNRVLIETISSPPGQYLYFPYVDGIVYWNEDMPTFSNDLDALAPPQYGYPTSELKEDENYIGWTQDVDGDGVITFITTSTGFPMAYRTMGLSTMPTITISPDNDIAVVFSSTTETFDNFEWNYKKLWMTVKYKDGAWGTFSDLTADISHIFDESIYPVAFPTWQGSFNLIYNNDASPGTALDANHDYQPNYTTFMNVYLYPEGVDDNPAINAKSTSLIISPNPSNGLVNASYSISSASNTALAVSDISGRVVFTRALGWKDAGDFRYTLNLENLSRGIYYVSLKTDQQEVSKKLVLN